MYRAAVLVGLCLSMYLQTHYVPRQEFKDAQESLWRKLTDISGSLVLINTQMAIRETDKDVMRDHELRLRALEQKR